MFMKLCVSTSFVSLIVCCFVEWSDRGALSLLFIAVLSFLRIFCVKVKFRIIHYSIYSQLSIKIFKISLQYNPFYTIL